MYTPGPWEVWETPIYCLIMAPGETVHRLADVYSYANGIKPTREERNSNARLIAAAPELLEALKEAVQDCSCSIRERDSGHKVGCNAPKWQEIITKAEGK